MLCLHVNEWIEGLRLSLLRPRVDTATGAVMIAVISQPLRGQALSYAACAPRKDPSTCAPFCPPPAPSISSRSPTRRRGLVRHRRQRKPPGGRRAAVGPRFAGQHAFRTLGGAGTGLSGRAGCVDQNDAGFPVQRKSESRRTGRNVAPGLDDQGERPSPGNLRQGGRCRGSRAGLLQEKSENEK